MVQESHHDHVEGLGISCDLCDPECNGACEMQNQIPTHNQEKSNSGGGGDYLAHMNMLRLINMNILTITITIVFIQIQNTL